MKEKLLALLRTLNLLEVRGEENLNHLLACIRFIQEMLKESEEEEVKKS